MSVNHHHPPPPRHRVLRKLLAQDLFVDAAILGHWKVTVDAQSQIVRAWVVGVVSSPFPSPAWCVTFCLGGLPSCNWTSVNIIEQFDMGTPYIYILHIYIYMYIYLFIYLFIHSFIYIYAHMCWMSKYRTEPNPSMNWITVGQIHVVHHRPLATGWWVPPTYKLACNRHSLSSFVMLYQVISTINIYEP